MRRMAPFIPYLAVAVGMYGFHSAWAAMGLYHAGALAAIALWKRQSPDKGKHSASLVWVPLTAVVFALGGVALYFLWPYLDTDSRLLASKLAYYGVNQCTWPYLAAYFCIVNSTVEEFLWRGYLGTESRRPVANDFLFAGYHVSVMLAFADVVWAVPVFVACVSAGWLWLMLRLATGGLAVPVITHVVADIGIVVAVHLRVFV